jgi:hypothetical protein
MPRVEAYELGVFRDRECLGAAEAVGPRGHLNAESLKPWPGDLEPRHRLRARTENRIRAARATGLRNLPLHTTARKECCNGACSDCRAVVMGCVRVACND